MRILISILLFFYASNILSQLYINEVFPAPNTNQSEWIELYNPNETTLIFDSLIVGNRTYTYVIPDTLNIPPKSFFILLKDTTGFNQFIDCGYKIIALPTLHNDWDAITIKSKNLTLLDSVYYNSRLVKKGVSIERIDWTEPGYILENLKNSTDTSGHTICKPNSQRLLNIDLVVKIEYRTGDCELKLVNNGIQIINNVSINASIILKDNNNIIPKNIFYYSISALKKKDTLTFTIPIISQFDSLSASLITTLNVEISYDSLGQKAKKLISEILSLPKPFTGILINEFLFDVYPGCGEFIELINNTSDTLNIDGWELVNSSGKRIYLRNENNNTQILPYNYFVVFWDSTFFNCFEELKGNDFYYSNSSFSLRNTGDQIVLLNKLGSVHDSLTFFPEWHKGKLTSYKQRSLEKKISIQSSFLPENWFTCVDKRGATPGMINSVSLEQEDKISLNIEPNPFSPNSSTKRTTKITYILPFSQARLNVTIYDLNGILIYTLANNLISPSNGEIVWDGTTNYGSKVAAGGYVLYFEAIDINTNRVATTKTTIGVGW
jgi:hypothetical protein